MNGTAPARLTDEEYDQVVAQRQADFKVIRKLLPQCPPWCVHTHRDDLQDDPLGLEGLLGEPTTYTRIHHSAPIGTVRPEALDREHITGGTNVTLRVEQIEHVTSGGGVERAPVALTIDMELGNDITTTDAVNIADLLRAGAKRLHEFA